MMKTTKFHVKIGTYPATFIKVPYKTIEIGQYLELKENNKTTRIRCTLIKNLGSGDILYYMELA